MLATRGIPTTWGASPYKDQVFDDDATVVKRLDAAGAVLCAKLSLGELAMGDVWFGGLTRNPWQPDQGSSGSSAGPAAATAAGLVAFTIGSETLGSIISPCQTCGTTGLRPTYGRVSRHGAMPLARTMDKLGPITRGVEDTALVLAAIHGADGLDPTAAADVPFRWDPMLDVKTLRVAYEPRAFDFEQDFYKKNPNLRELYEPAFERLRDLVGELRPIQLPPAEPYTGLAGLVIACESAASFTELLTSGRVRELKQQGRGSWPNAFRVGSTIPASDYLRAQQVRTQLQRAMAEAMRDVDAYVTIPYVGPTVAFTNLTGHPSLVTRAGMLDERPRSIEFVGNLYREDAICALGHAFERATGAPAWPETDKIPPLARG
jgi:Asp-tRNA(Asn)/Glu-tRNA(Gln) amidotransferase A subunit family amidase